MTAPINEEDDKWFKSENGLFLPKKYHADSDITETKSLFLKKEIDWLLNNFTVVLLFNSLLGTVWQIFELSMINISYIRFFSLSQIPVDGALISFLILIFYVMGRLIKSFLLHTSEAKMERLTRPDTLEKTINTLDSTIKKDVLSLVVLIVITVALAIYFIQNIFHSSPWVTIFLFGFFTLGGGLIASEIIILYCIKLYDSNPNIANIEDTLRTGLEQYKSYIAGLAITSIVVAVILFSLLVKSISSNFILPIDLYNTENMQNVVYSDFKTTTYDVEYMNDQYIFISLCTTKSCEHELDKKIVIYPTEKALFE